MTAVAVQQRAPRQQYNPRQSPQPSSRSSPHPSRPQSYINTPPSHTQQPEIANGGGATNGAASTTNHRPAVSNDPQRIVVAQGAPVTDAERNSPPSGANVTSIATASAREWRESDELRPASAPKGKTASSTALNRQDPTYDISDVEQVKRAKPMLLRSKSDYGPRGESPDTRQEIDAQDWGARHGFEDHYASEEYVSQLANVSRSFLLNVPDPSNDI